MGARTFLCAQKFRLAGHPALSRVTTVTLVILDSPLGQALFLPMYIGSLPKCQPYRVI